MRTISLVRVACDSVGSSEQYIWLAVCERRNWKFNWTEHFIKYVSRHWRSKSVLQEFYKIRKQAPQTSHCNPLISENLHVACSGRTALYPCWHSSLTSEPFLRLVPAGISWTFAGNSESSRHRLPIDRYIEKNVFIWIDNRITVKLIILDREKFFFRQFTKINQEKIWTGKHLGRRADRL